MEQREITIGQALANAAEAVKQQAALAATPYPVEGPESKPTWTERWAAFWRARHIRQLEDTIRANKTFLEEIPEMANRDRREAAIDYNLLLEEIAATERAANSLAHLKIARAEAELRKLEG